MVIRIERQSVPSYGLRTLLDDLGHLVELVEEQRGVPEPSQDLFIFKLVDVGQEHVLLEYFVAEMTRPLEQID